MPRTESIACYARVSTAEQNLDRQIESTREYALRSLDANPGDLVLYTDKSTGTDTARGGYQEIVEDAADGQLDAVVVHSVSRISRSVRDLDRTVTTLREYGVALHIISENLVLRPGDDDPYQTALFQLLGVFAELEAKLAQQRTREGIATRMNNDEYHHGPAPLGFEKNDGQLVEAADYDRVCTVLSMKAKGEMGTREAARELECGTATVNRALERGKLYGI